MDKKKVVEIKGLVKNYGTRGFQTRVLKGIDLTIYENDFIAIMGPSGSGKTTLLNILSTIDKPTQGTVLLDGKDVTKLKNKELSQIRRDKIGFIFQDYNLIDTLTVYENIALALSINNIKPKDIQRRIENVSNELRIYDILDKYPYQISGGQKQRCACARAIINSPNVVLADEPTGALDSNSSKRLMELLSYMNRSLNATIILVTHDSMCASYADRVIFLKDGSIYAQLEKKGCKGDDFYNHILKKMSEIEGR